MLVRGEGVIEGHGLSPMLRLPPIPSEAGFLVAMLVAIENIAGSITIFLLQQHPVIFHYCTIQARKHISVYRAIGNTVGDLELPLCVLGATPLYVLGLRFIRSPPLPLGGGVLQTAPRSSWLPPPGHLSRRCLGVSLGVSYLLPRQDSELD